MKKSNVITQALADDLKLPLEKLSNPMWRICSGELYWIVVKDDNSENSAGKKMRFILNKAQLKFIKRLWYRNNILKARQLGMTTLILIMWLDYALFNENSKCGVIAQTDDAAISLFADKVKFAYENLPEPLRRLMPLKSDNAHEYLFAHNGSQIRVATSMRSGTYHRLHVSEFGKICAESPKKAKEVVSGSLQSVPADGIAIIESTAEGIDGAHYKMTQAAIKLAQAGNELTKEQYRFNFFGWYEDEGYRINPKGIHITEAKHDYFDSVESKANVTLDMKQRAWYVAKELSFIEAGIAETMLQEYPSTPEESFQVSLEGTYFSKQMTAMRKEGRIARLPVLDTICNTFWDIGGTAGTVIWVIQKVGNFWRCIDFYKHHSESFSHAVKWLNERDYLYNKHFLPHDAGHEHQGQDKMETAQSMLEELGLKNTEIVPVISSLDLGIELLRKYFTLLQIDEVKCADGISDLDAYKKRFDTKQGTYRNEPEKHDGHSEAPDALRQWAQALHWNMITTSGSTRLNRIKTTWRTV